MATIWVDVDAAIAEAPVNISALVDATDFKTREEAVTFDQAGMDLVWNFVTTAGAYTQTAVTPTAAGNYDWTNEGNGMYAIEIPASGGASINNDTEGHGWFTGFATGVLPWTGPVLGFRAAGLNNLLIDDAFSATRGLAGTALPAAAADAAGGLPISDAGGLDLDAQILTDIDAILVDTGTTLDQRIPAALVSGRMDSSVGAVAANAITAASIATDAISSDELATSAVDEIVQAIWNEATAGNVTAGTFGAQLKTVLDSVQTDTDDIQTRLPAALVSGRIDASVGAVATAAITADAIAADAIGSSELATTAVDEIVQAVWNEATAGNVTAGTFGAQLKTVLDTAATDAAAAATPAEVATQVVNALSSDTYAEPTSVIGASASITAMLAWIKALTRNKLTFNKTTGVATLKADDTTTTVATSTDTDDGTTVTRNEWV
jgi:hypothetical protein